MVTVPLHSEPVLQLDMDDFRAGGKRCRKFLRAFRRSWHASGFAVFKNSRINHEVIALAYKKACEFFDLPLEIRQKYEQPQNGRQRGYTSPKIERAAGSTIGDLKHFLHWGRRLPIYHTFFTAYCANVDIAEIIDLNMALDAAYSEFDRFSDEIGEAISLLLGMPRQWFNWFKKNGDSILRVLDYPAFDGIEVEPGAVRASQHTDIDLFALLVADRNEGLEVFVNGDWIRVNVGQGDVVVNAGDMMNVLSGGYFPSAWHRVVNPNRTNERRMSMPFFVHPPRAAVLEVVPKFHEYAGPDRARRLCTAGWYLMHRLIQIELLEGENPYAKEGTNPADFPPPALPMAA